MSSAPTSLIECKIGTSDLHTNKCRHSHDLGHSKCARCYSGEWPSVFFGKIANVSHKCENYDNRGPGKANKEDDLQNPDEKMQHISPSSPDAIAVALKKT